MKASEDNFLKKRLSNEMLRRFMVRPINQLMLVTYSILEMNVDK